MAAVANKLRPILTTFVSVRDGRPRPALRVYKFYALIDEFIPWLLGAGVVIPSLGGLVEALETENASALTGQVAVGAVVWMAVGWLLRRAKMHEQSPVIEVCKSAFDQQRSIIDGVLATYKLEVGADGAVSQPWAHLEGLLDRASGSVSAIESILRRTDAWTLCANTDEALSKELAKYESSYPEVWQVARAPHQKPKPIRARVDGIGGPP